MDFGALSGLVGTVGSIFAAAAAIALTWRGRRRWEPSETDIPNGPQRVGGLVNAVLIAVLYVISRPSTSGDYMSGLAVALAIICVVALLAYSFVTATQTYDDAKRHHKVIGGFRLTAAAQKATKREKVTTQQFFSDATYDPDQVWPRGSRAFAKVTFVFLYLLLVVSGTMAIAAAAILVEKSTTPSEPTGPIVDQRTLRWIAAPEGGEVLDGGVYYDKSVWLEELFPGSPPTVLRVIEVVDSRLPKDVRDAVASANLPEFAPTVTGHQAVSDRPWRLPLPSDGVGSRAFYFTDEPDRDPFRSGTIVSGAAQVSPTLTAPQCLAPGADGAYFPQLGDTSCLQLTVTGARDPTFDVKVLVPWGEGDSDLLAAMREYFDGIDAQLARDDPSVEFDPAAALDAFLQENAQSLPTRAPVGWLLTADPSVVDVRLGTQASITLQMSVRSGGAALIAIQLVNRSDGTSILSPLLPILVTGNAQPLVSITEPPRDLVGSDRLSYTGFDSERQMWYTEVRLEALATDPEDGVLTGNSVTWTTDQASLQPAILGTGTLIDARLYSTSCDSGAIHTITVTVSDSQGAEETATRQIQIGQIC